MSQSHDETYSFAVVVPTRNRAGKLEQCLVSLAKQTKYRLRVVIVASGNDVSDVAGNFRDVLDIQYVQSNKRGQIRQRNIGIKMLLDEETDYICFLDDDMVVESGSISSIREFIDRKRSNEEYIFGVGLNIVNNTNYEQRRFLGIKKFLFRVGDSSGSVTRSGMNTSIENVRQDIRSGWLGGGFTVWSAAILRQYPQMASKTRHAAGEDLIYSYVVGKEYNLYVCSEARVIHQDEPSTDVGIVKYRIRKDTVAHCVFCDQHEELSAFLFIVTGLIYHFLLLFMPGKKGLAQLVGFLIGLYDYLSHRKSGAKLLDD